MAGNTLLPLAGYPLSRQQLARRIGTKDPIFKFLEYQALKDAVFYKDDFDYVALDANRWVVTTKGSTATEWAVSAGLNGRILGVGGTTAASSGLQFLSPIACFSGDKNAGFEIRYQIDDITECRLEMGFVNAFPSINSPCVNNLSTPTFTTTTNAAIYCYNHTGSTTTSGLYCIGTATVGAANKTATTTKRPVNNTSQVVRIQMIGNTVHMWIDGVYMAAATMEGGDAMKFGVNFKGNSTNDHNWLVDYIAHWVDRT